MPVQYEVAAPVPVDGYTKRTHPPGRQALLRAGAIKLTAQQSDDGWRVLAVRECLAN